MWDLSFKHDKKLGMIAFKSTNNLAKVNDVYVADSEGNRFTETQEWETFIEDVLSLQMDDILKDLDPKLRTVLAIAGVDLTYLPIIPLPQLEQCLGLYLEDVNVKISDGHF